MRRNARLIGVIAALLSQLSAALITPLRSAAHAPRRRDVRAPPRIHEPTMRIELRAAPINEDPRDDSNLIAILSVVAAGVFGAGIYATTGEEKALEFCAGYVVEQSLSVDNLLVFLVLFEYFRVPPGPMQDKALAYGLYDAVVCRAVFVGLGAVALADFRGVLLVFAGILVASSAKILFFSEEEDDEDVSQNAIVKWVNSQSLVPATDAFDSEDPSKFFTLDSEGVRRATPLLAAVACLELSDIVFAVDSVPAVFGVSEDPFIVYTSNMFAILGLRAWYGVLSRAAHELVYLEKAVALVLGFVGAKLGAEYFGQEVSTETSLAVIFVILGAGVAASLLAPPPDDDESSSL